MQLAVRRIVAVGATVVLTAFMTACGPDVEHPSVAPLAQISLAEPTEAQNGIDKLEPADALARSLDAMRATGSYHVSGTTNAGNAIDISFKVGVGSVGTVTTDNPVKLVAIGGIVYVTGDPASLAAQVGADVGKTIAGKWLLIPAASTTKFSIFEDGATFAAAVLGAEAPSGITKPTKVDGVPAVGLLFAHTGATLWVAATGEPLPLSFEEKGASAGTGVLTFGNFGAEVAVAPPPDAAVVDVSKLSPPAAPADGATPAPPAATTPPPAS